MPATTTVLPKLAFGALTGSLVGRPLAIRQFSFQASSTALNLTIAFPGWPTALFNALAPICTAVRPFIATKLTCPVLSSKLVSSQFCFVVISSSNHSKVLPLIQALKCPIALSLPVATLSFGSIF
jgi:hypothetical protein